MKTEIKILACAAILGATILTGCNKNGLDGIRGKEIRFSSVSNGPSTKTQYGDVSGTKQALNWVNGDIIRIASPSTHVTDNPNLDFADYSVTLTTSGVPSKGTLTNVAENGLAWGDAPATYTFFGIYPSTTQNSKITLTSAGAVSAYIPGEQPLNGTASSKQVADGNATITYDEYKPDMLYAYMTSKTVYNLQSSAFGDNNYVTKLVDGGPNVDMAFDPAFTAFEINLSSGDEDFTISRVELVGDNGTPKVTTDDFPLYGTFTMTAGDVFATTPITVGSDAGNSVYVTMDQALTTATGISFTLFTLPKDNTGIISLKVTIKTGTDTTEVGTLKLTAGENTPYVFKAGHKYRINLLKLGGRWKILFGELTVDEWIPAEGSTNLIVE